MPDGHARKKETAAARKSPGHKRWKGDESIGFWWAVALGAIGWVATVIAGFFLLVGV